MSPVPRGPSKSEQTGAFWWLALLVAVLILASVAGGVVRACARH